MNNIKREDLDDLFEEYSEKFTYALGLQDDLTKLCRIVRFCIKTEDVSIIHKALRSLSIAHNNITKSPNFVKEDRDLFLDMVDAMLGYYMQKAEKFFR